MLAFWVQLVPFHSQVSLVGAGEPPLMTVTPRTESKHIACWVRAPGEEAGVRSVQFDPFHSQVSLSNVPTEFWPPNMTTTPRALSKAIAWNRRPDGDVAGVSCVQLVPSNSQVSLRYV